MIVRHAICAAAFVASLVIVAAPPAVSADDLEAEATYEDVRETYGFVPGFFRLFERDDVADAWQAFRTLQLNPYLTMEARTRELISVAVAAQGPCRACVYFHAAAAFANGASQEAIREAVGVGAATRRFNDLIMNARADVGAFRHETDLVLWGDAATIARRGPPPGFCDFIVAWADAGYAGC